MRTRFVRVGRSGPTVDGRTISPEMIDQAAATYDRAVYQARINLEHFRGLLPDGPFRMYGDVLALRAEADGDARVLLAQLDITEDLVGILGKRQKTHWSMELQENFAGTDKTYLVGLAVTDQPASLATEALTFAAKHQPLLFGSVFETDSLTTVDAPACLPAADPAPAGPSPTDAPRPLLEQLAALLPGAPRRRDNDRLTTIETGILQLADSIATLERTHAASRDQVTALAGQVSAIKAAHTGLTETLARDPATPTRPIGSGTPAATETDV